MRIYTAFTIFFIVIIITTIDVVYQFHYHPHYSHSYIPLYRFAAGYGHLNVVRWLLLRGCDINYNGGSGSTLGPWSESGTGGGSVSVSGSVAGTGTGLVGVTGSGSGSSGSGSGSALIKAARFGHGKKNWTF